MNKKLHIHTYILMAGALILVASLVFIYTTFFSNQSKNSELQNGASSFTIEKLEQRPTVHSTMRLEENVIPPTNRWFSGLVFGDAQVAFAYPLSYKATSSGFEISVPRINATANTVSAPHLPEIVVDLHAQSYKISSYDDLSVKSKFILNNNGSAEVIVTQGVPIVFIQSEGSIEANIYFSNISDINQIDDGTLLFTTTGQRYGIVAEDISIIENNQVKVTLSKKSNAAIFAIPSDATNVDAYIESAKNPVTSTNTEYLVADEKIVTNHNILTNKNNETIFGKFSTTTSSDDALGSFDTLYGKLQLSKGQSFSYIQDAEKPILNFDISKLSSNEKEELTRYLVGDTKELKLEKTDTYFGGKELYRAANLLMIAKELEEDEIALNLQEVIRKTLDVWLNPDIDRNNRYFYYDKTIKGVSGVESAFGSEDFNDHHFHYGYFIYAASIVAQYDDSFVSDNGAMIENLISDIASETETNDVPRLRVFDTFVGHSWASGFSDFADGNNQESSSEAVNAWYGVYRWANVTNNNRLTDFSLWLYTSEVNSARNFWLSDNRDKAGFEGYNHPLISLVWNGKRDYATFFSPRPQAQLGIQLIPMSLGHSYLADTDIKKNLTHVAPESTDYQGQFGDYLTMYLALTDPDKAIEQVKMLNQSSIDDANSKTYLSAWAYQKKYLQ